MTEYADPKQFWQQRLSDAFDLRGAGYAGLGENYNSVLYQARLRALTRALDRVALRLQDAKILEIGTGTGFYTRLCKDAGVSSYTGIDISAASVERLRADFPSYRFLQADAGAALLPLGAQFDVVIAADVLFHITEDKAFRIALDNIALHLAVGGYCVLSDVFSVATSQPVAHCRFRGMSEYNRELEARGLRIRHIQPVFAVLQPPAYVPGTSIGWKLYERSWRHILLRLAKLRVFDRYVPSALSRLDEQMFLPRASVGTPNTKWLIAQKIK